ncbi:MAG TPA: hypothetical protein VHG28_04925, partial [Longimicrobiaceae bacterium]|nr:hypothetical protein [Longimicrobiaceae bacterium]
DLTGTAYVTIRYDERTTDTTTETGAEGDRRWQEVPSLSITREAPVDPDNELVLGRVTIDKDGVSLLDDGDAAARRKVAGPAPGAELEVRSLTVRNGPGVAGVLTAGSSVVGGGAAGVARLRAEGATPRLVFGAGGADVLTVHGDNVGIGTTSPGYKLHVKTGKEVGLFESTDTQAYLRFQTSEGENNRVEFCNRPGGHAAIFVVGGGDALYVRRDGATQIPFRLSIGSTAAPGARLDVAGGSDVGTTEGDFRVGSDAHRLKVGVTLTGPGAGDARMRAEGGNSRLILGAGGTDVLTVHGNNVGIGTTSPTYKLHVRAGEQVGLFESTVEQAYLRFQTSEGEDHRVEFCNRPGGNAAIYVVGGGDALYVRRGGFVQIPRQDSAMSSPLRGARLHVAGGSDLATTEGDFKVGSDTHRLKVGVTLEGPGAGDARIRAEGGTSQLILGAAGADVMTVQKGGVGIGAAPAAGYQLNVGGAINATEVNRNGKPLVSSQWTGAEGGIAYANGHVGIGTASPAYRLHVRAGEQVGLFESTVEQAYLRFQTSEGEDHRVEFCNRPGGNAAIYVVGGGDALYVRRGGFVQIPRQDSAVSGPLRGARLHVAGGSDLATTEGDLKVGNDDHRLKVGVTLEGPGAGEARLRAEGATPRLILGAGGTDVLTVHDGNVGIGTTSPTYKLHVKTGREVGLFESEGKEAFLRFQTSEGFENRVEFCNRAGGNAAIYVNGFGDALLVEREGSVHIRKQLHVDTINSARGLTVNGNVTVTGRVSDARIREEAYRADPIHIESPTAHSPVYQDIPGMTLTVNPTTPAKFLIRFQMGGVQITKVAGGQALFRLLVNKAECAFTQMEFRSDGYELRPVALERILYLTERSNTITVQWSTTSPHA